MRRLVVPQSSRSEDFSTAPPADARTYGRQTAKYPHDEKVVTRVLDNPRISHGPVMFQHNRRDTIDGFLARPKADGEYPVVVVIARNVIGGGAHSEHLCRSGAGRIYRPRSKYFSYTDTRGCDTGRTPKGNHRPFRLDALLDINSGLDYLYRSRIPCLHSTVL